MEQTLEPLRTRAFSVWQYILLVRIIFTISKQMLHAVRCRDFRGSIQMRITQCRLKGRVTEIHLNFLQGIALMQQQCCTGVPEIMHSNDFQVIPLEKFLKVTSNIIWLEYLPE